VISVGRCSPMTLDSGDIRFIRIIAGVPWKGGVIQQWFNRKRVQVSGNEPDSPEIKEAVRKKI